MALLKTSIWSVLRGAGTCPHGFWLAGLLLSLFCSLQVAAAEPVTSREYQIKAVFLFNFAQFVDWPPQALPTPQTPFVIGVLGDDPFGSVLDETVLGERIGQRAITVRRYHQVEEINGCQILFISGSESERLETILAGLKDRAVLTVCDGEGMAKRGVMIRFVNDKNKIRLRINLEMAKAAGLTISSKLLRPAEIVTTTQL